MTDSEINAAIAEACGWQRIRLGTQSQNDPEPRGWLSPKTNDWRYGRVKCPDYYHDLNAMHEAEKLIGSEQFGRNAGVSKYVKELWGVMHLSPQACVGLIHATARQRAEAFLRTIGKWREA